MKQIAVLGLSRFGASVARSLETMGVEVMGVDSDKEKVADLAHDITHVVQADILDSDALDSLGLRNFDVVILSVKDVEISCLATMALKDHGAAKVVAQASGEAHAKILERIGADKVIMPERIWVSGWRAAWRATISWIIWSCPPATAWWKSRRWTSGWGTPSRRVTSVPVTA